MSAPLPDCAYCGKDLIRQVRILLHWGDIPGSPTIGWHGDCWEADKFARESVPGARAGPACGINAEE